MNTSDPLFLLTSSVWTQKRCQRSDSFKEPILFHISLNFLFVRYLCVEKKGLLAVKVTSKWFSSLWILSRELVDEQPEVSGWQTNVEVFVIAVWITTGCLFFPFLPHIHCMASYLRHEHILQISHSGTFLHPTPSLPKGLLDNEWELS